MLADLPKAVYCYLQAWLRRLFRCFSQRVHGLKFRVPSAMAWFLVSESSLRQRETCRSFVKVVRFRKPSSLEQNVTSAQSANCQFAPPDVTSNCHYSDWKDDSVRETARAVGCEFSGLRVQIPAKSDECLL